MLRLLALALLARPAAAGVPVVAVEPLSPGRFALQAQSRLVELSRLPPAEAAARLAHPRDLGRLSPPGQVAVNLLISHSPLRWNEDARRHAKRTMGPANLQRADAEALRLMEASWDPAVKAAFARAHDRAIIRAEAIERELASDEPAVREAVAHDPVGFWTRRAALHHGDSLSAPIAGLPDNMLVDEAQERLRDYRSARRDFLREKNVPGWVIADIADLWPFYPALVEEIARRPGARRLYHIGLPTGGVQ